MVLKKKVLTNKMVPMEYAYLRRGLTLLGNAVILAYYINYTANMVSLLTSLVKYEKET